MEKPSSPGRRPVLFGPLWLLCVGRCYPLACRSSLPGVTELLIVTDSRAVLDEVRSAVEGPEVTVRWARTGRVVLPALRERAADLVISDMQAGTMGALAVAMDLALEAGAGRLDPTPVLVLLDRRPDVFLARRTGVAGYLLKPLDPLRTAEAVEAILSGQRYEDPSFTPAPADILPI